MAPAEGPATTTSSEPLPEDNEDTQRAVDAAKSAPDKIQEEDVTDSSPVRSGKQSPAPKAKSKLTKEKAGSKTTGGKTTKQKTPAKKKPQKKKIQKKIQKKKKQIQKRKRIPWMPTTVCHPKKM